MMMEIMMMTKYDDDERVGKRIRGRRNWPDSGAAGGAGEIRRRHRGAADLLYYKKHFRRKFVCARTCVRARMRKTCKRACSTYVCKENANGKVLYVDDG